MKESPINRWLYNGIFLLLAIMSVYFYKERLFVDSSYMIFKTINKGWFHIEHGRPAHALTQVLPLIGYAFKLSLKWLLILYSLGQVLIFYLLFLLFDRVFNKPAAIIALLGIVLIGQSWLYYIAMLEILMGAVLAVLALTIMQSDKWKQDGWMLLLFLAYWMILSSHPLNYLLALVILLFDLLKRGWNKRLHLSMILLFFAALFVEWLGHDSYEAQKFVGIGESGLMQLTSFSFIKASLWLILKRYWLILILGAISTIFFIQKGKKYLAMIWPYSFILLYLAAVYRWDISQDDWYSELSFQPFVSISMILFCFSIVEGFSAKKQSRLMKGFGLVFIGFAVALIYNSDFMRDRSQQIEYLSNQLQHQNVQKAQLELVNISRPYNNWLWSVPVEALLLSSLDGPENSVSMISRQDLEYEYNKQLLSKDQFVFRKFELMDLKELNPRYFEIQEGDYEPMNTSRDLEFVKQMADSIAIYPNTEDKSLRIPAGKEVWVDIVLENRYYRYLPSAVENNLSIASHWFHADTLYNWDGVRTPAELDVVGTHYQQIKLMAPKEKGIYEIQFDMVKEGEYWLELPARYLVQVY